MICKWKSSSHCLKLFKSIQHTNTMVNIAFDSNGLHIMAMDTSKTSLVKLDLKPDYFETFLCSSPMVFGVYTETLTNILQKAKQSSVQWQATGDLALTVVFTAKDFKTEFTLRSIHIEEDPLDITELEDDVSFQVSADVVRDCVDKVLMTKSDVVFTITNDQFVCSSESTELGEIKHTEPVGGERLHLNVFRNCVNIALSFHSTRSLVVFAGCGGNSCSIGFSNHQPSRIQVKLSPLHYTSESTLCLYVAPKIMTNQLDD